MKVSYRLNARLDIENIHEYIAERSPHAATGVVARIRYAGERLGMWPYMGHVGRAPDILSDTLTLEDFLYCTRPTTHLFH